MRTCCFFGLFATLSLPVFVSYGYSNSPQATQVLLPLAALACALWFLQRLAGLPASAHSRSMVFSGGVAVIACFQLARVVSYYFQGESFNTQFFYHLEFSNARLAWQAYLRLLVASCLWLATVLVLGWLTAPRQPSTTARHRLAGAALLMIVLEPDILGYLRYRHQLLTDPWRDASLVTDATLAQHALDPRALNGELGQAAPGRNLVFIYLESLEAAYFDQSRFGGDLVPNLRRLRAAGLDFDNLVQTAGTGYTIAGIVASQCGTPLLFPLAPDGNDILHNGFLDNVHCLGDVLHEAGYRQVFMGGASRDFAGKGHFFSAHRYDRVLGREELAPLLPDPDYQTGWGLYDDSLFQLARSEFRALADSGQPFNLTLLTLDTHHPDGHPSASCKPYPAVGNSMLHAVHCSDQLVAAFIADISQHPVWQDTMVVLVSDHYAMRNVAQRFYPPVDERRLLFTVLNAGRSGSIHRAGSITDIAPTLLDLMQVRHDGGFLAGWSLVDAAAPQLTHEDYADPARNNLIRHLNASVLTNTPAQLCESPPFLAKEPGSILIADRRIAIAAQGQPLPEGSLRATHSFLALWDKAGYLRSSMIVANEALPGLLFRFRGENFVTLGIADALPAVLQERTGLRGRGRVALVGNLLGEVRPLPMEDLGETLTADVLACDRILHSIASTVTLDEPALVAEYCAAEQLGTGRMNADHTQLRLNLVQAEGGWFEATLRRNAEGLFQPLSYRQIEPDEDAVCYAQLTADALHVPAAVVDGERQILRFKRVAGDELLFELN